MNTSERSSVEALNAIRTIPEWLRAASDTASELRRNLDLLEKEAAQFRTILDSAKERRMHGSFAKVRTEASDLIAGIGDSAALMRQFQSAFEHRCPANDPATEVPTRVGTLTLTYVPAFVRLNGDPVSFTRTEERLLAALWSARGSALSGAELTDRVWSKPLLQKTLSVHISNLRKKLDDFGIVIEFNREVGYRLVLESGTRRR